MVVVSGAGRGRTGVARDAAEARLAAGVLADLTHALAVHVRDPARKSDNATQPSARRTRTRVDGLPGRWEWEGRGGSTHGKAMSQQGPAHWQGGQSIL